MNKTKLPPVELEIFQAKQINVDERPASYSTLKKILKSPRHFADNWLHRKKPTDDMMLGSIVDCLLLEPDQFPNRFLVAPNIGKRSKSENIAWCQFYMDHAPEQLDSSFMVPDKTWKLDKIKDMRDSLRAQLDLTVITEDMLETAVLMTKAVENDELAMELVNCTTQTQKSITWSDKETGINLRGFIDQKGERDGTPFICDLKTATDASTEAFMRHATSLEMCYDVQAAAYWRAELQNTGEMNDYYFIVVEKTAPFAVNVLKADNRFMQLGKVRYRKALDRLADCLKHDTFNDGYTYRREYAASLGIPGWLMNEIE